MVADTYAAQQSASCLALLLRRHLPPEDACQIFVPLNALHEKAMGEKAGIGIGPSDHHHLHEGSEATDKESPAALRLRRVKQATRMLTAVA
jgi:hypothetical protein